MFMNRMIHDTIHHSIYLSSLIHDMICNSTTMVLFFKKNETLKMEVYGLSPNIHNIATNIRYCN